MPKPNNPYARPINATKESAKTVGELYGTPATGKAHVHAAGPGKASPAARYQAAGNAYVAPSTPAAPAKKEKAKPYSAQNKEAITAKDLFE